MTEVVEHLSAAGTPEPGVRVFDNAAIQAAIDKALKTVPEGKSGAVVAFVDTDKTVRLSIAGRLGDQWSIVAEAKKPYHKPIEGSAAVVFTWP